MSNVEIHGLRSPDAEIMRANVFSAFAGQSLVADMVVTIYYHSVRDFAHKSQPFFRLYSSSDNGEEGFIIPVLLELGLDVEHVKLEAFYPKYPKE